MTVILARPPGASDSELLQPTLFNSPIEHCQDHCPLACRPCTSALVHVGAWRAWPALLSGSENVLMPGRFMNPVNIYKYLINIPGSKDVVDAKTASRSPASASSQHSADNSFFFVPASISRACSSSRIVMYEITVFPPVHFRYYRSISVVIRLVLKW